MIREQSERHPVDRLAEEFVARYRRGERPSIAEYAARYPDLANELQELLTALVLMEEHGPAAVSVEDEAGGEGAAAAGGRIPDRLGEYRIIREIGRGGMGVVYEAVQEPLGRHVALKVLLFPGLVDPTRRKRFQREVQVAAKLHHTNIVPVFGVGEWRAGDASPPVHYYAMQFIPGRGLDEVIDELQRLKGAPRSAPPAPTESAANTISADLSTLSDTPRYYRSVARLGEQVAEALEHAHRQGILHRDIKPGNLLLDGLGTVWITDFGLAKGEGMEELTHTGDLVGTLRYLAPERLRGEGDARADVYSLGLTLYELLTLRPAFDASDRAALVRQITQDSPPRPRKLDARIPRDLETIVLKACAKEPQRRYAKAGELAEDLRRFLGDRPIEARRTAWWEHAWRWCRRNPGVAASSSAAVAALLIGLGIALWQWHRADDNAKRAEANAAQANKDFELAFQAIDQMLERVGGERLVGVPHMDRTRRALLEDAARFYRDLLRGKEDHPELRLAMARTYCRLGQIEFWLDHPHQAIRHEDQALALLGDLLVNGAGNVEHRGLAARIHLVRAWVKASLEQFGDAEADYRRALAGWDSLREEWPERSDFAIDRASALLLLGDLLRSASRLAEAESALRQSIAIAERLPDSEPAGSERSRLLANALNALTLVLDESGNLAEAERACRRALELFERSARANPEPARRYELAGGLRNLAQLQARDPRARAQSAKLYLRALELGDRLVADFPDVSAYRVSLAETSHGLGLVRSLQGRAPEAEKIFERSAALYQVLSAKFPEGLRYRVELAGALNNLAQQRRARGDTEGARALLEEAIGHQEAVLKTDHRHTQSLVFLANHYGELADLLLHLRQPGQAEKTVWRQRATAQELAEKDGQCPVVRVFQARACENLARLRMGTRRFDEAEQHYGEAAGHWRRLAHEFPANPGYASQLGAVLNNAANACRLERRWAEMIPLLDEAIRLQEAAVRARPEERLYQEFLYKHYSLRAEAGINLGDHGHVFAAAAALRERFPERFDPYVWAVRVSRCIPLAEKDVHLSQETRGQLVHKYADESMSLLRAAQQKKSTSLPQIHTQPAFQPLRARADFQELLAAVTKPTK